MRYAVQMLAVVGLALASPVSAQQALTAQDRAAIRS